MMNKVLIIMSGIPCSGKSFLTSKIITLVGFNGKDITLSPYKTFKIERDEIFTQVGENNKDLSKNKKTKLISESINLIYDEFNNYDSNAILIVDSCSGTDELKEFIMNKAKSKTKTIIINFIPKTIDGVLDLDFYLSRANSRPPHYVFPKTRDEQIKELQKCYKYWTLSKPSDKYTTINLEHDWKIEDIKTEFFIN